MNIRISESEDQLFIQSVPLDSTRTFTQRTVSRSEIILRAEIRNNNFGMSWYSMLLLCNSAYNSCKDFGVSWSFLSWIFTSLCFVLVAAYRMCGCAFYLSPLTTDIATAWSVLHPRACLPNRPLSSSMLLIGTCGPFLLHAASPGGRYFPWSSMIGSLRVPARDVL